MKTLIAIARWAIGICIAVMLISTAIILGFKHDITEKIFGFWGHIHVTSTQVNLNGFQHPIEYDPEIVGLIKELDKTEVELHTYAGTQVLKSSGGVRSAEPYVILPGVLKKDTDIEGIQLKGVGARYDWSFLQEYLQKGAAPSLTDSVVSRDLLISQSTADRMRLDVGDQVVMHFVLDENQLQRKMTVSGVYRTGLEEYDRLYALCDMRVLQQLLKWEPNQIGGYEVVLDDFKDMDAINAYMYEYVLPGTWYSETQRQRSPQIFDWLDLQDINEVVILSLLTLVSIINMITVIIILILERTRMIGVLKALGATNWTIRKIFLYKAGQIVLGSLLIGNIIGLGFCFLQKYFKFFKLSESDYYLSYVPILIDYKWIITINLAAVALIIAFLVIPSYLVARIDPVKALRFT